MGGYATPTPAAPTAFCRRPETPQYRRSETPCVLVFFGGASHYTWRLYLLSNLWRSHPRFCSHAKRVRQRGKCHMDMSMTEPVAPSGIAQLDKHYWPLLANISSAFVVAQSSPYSKVQSCHNREGLPLCLVAIGQLLRQTAWGHSLQKRPPPPPNHPLPGPLGQSRD